MGMTLGTGLRLRSRVQQAAGPAAVEPLSYAFTGAGGKTSTIFSLARELTGPSLITTTTHLGAWQADLADRHIVAKSLADLAGLDSEKVTMISGPKAADDRLSSVSPELLNELRAISLTRGFPLLIEADGARQKPLKAPGEAEPQVPSFSELVVVVAGMEGLHRPLDEHSVHRPEVFASLSGLLAGESVTVDGLARVLVHVRGGLKGIPRSARRIALLNQADTSELQAEALRVARAIEGSYDAVVITSARAGTVHAALEPTAGIILAAGGATRYGSVKQLLPWRGKPLVRAAAQTALAAGLSQVVVVTGAHAPEVEAAVRDLNVTLARNEDWTQGQASSIRSGLEACAPNVGSAVFVLADQPFVSPELIRTLCDAHASEAAAIVAPLIGGDRRGNPVLFDRETFADLRGLDGDAGGRALFSRHRVHYVPWHDERVIQDIDSEEDYRRALGEEAA